MSPIDELRLFFDRPTCRDAIRPLRNGVELKVVPFESSPLTLTKVEKGVTFQEGEPRDPDLTVLLAKNSLTALSTITANDVGDMGVELLKLMAHSDPLVKIRVRVHVGLFGFLKNGYLGILPLGGVKVTQFLASKGLSSMGKIKQAIDSLRS